MQYVKGIFKGVTIDLAIHSYSVLILCLLYIIFAWIFAYLFSSPGQRPSEFLPSLGIRRPSPSVVRRKLPHLNLLLWKPWTKLNQTWQGWSLGGSLSKLCPTAPPLHSRWLLLLKIETSFIVYCYFIVSQNEVKLNCSCMTINRSTFLPSFLWNCSFSQFIQIDKKNHIKIFCLETWA